MALPTSRFRPTCSELRRPDPQDVGQERALGSAIQDAARYSLRRRGSIAAEDTPQMKIKHLQNSEVRLLTFEAI
jgi:hypothetical protein